MRGLVSHSQRGYGPNALDNVESNFCNVSKKAFVITLFSCIIPNPVFFSQVLSYDLFSVILSATQIGEKLNKDYREKVGNGNSSSCLRGRCLKICMAYSDSYIKSRQLQSFNTVEDCQE